MSLDSEIRRELSRRGGLSPARLRILRLRRVIRLRRKLRSQASAGQAPCARDTSGVKRTAPRVPRASTFGLLMLALAACAGAAWGCGWSGFENSVRFGYNSEGWRTRLPPLSPDSEVANATVEEWESSEAREAGLDKLWDDAGGVVAAGELEKARQLLNRYVEHTADLSCLGDWPAGCRDRRNSALDRLDALASLGRGSRAEDVRSYLEARAAYDEWLAGVKLTLDEQQQGYEWSKPTPEQQATVARKNEERASGMRTWDEQVEARLRAAERDPNLADNAAYLRAVGIYRAGVRGDAREAFESVVAHHPRGEKREAALFMAGRLALESSAVYLGGETATAEDPCREPECRDEGWARAQKNFKQLLKDYPRGRYASDARGWLAYLDYRVGDTAGALAEFYRMLADGGDAAGREQAAISLRLMRYRANGTDLDALERDLEDEPEAALVYSYHSIYNYASGDDLFIKGEEEESEACEPNAYYEECQRREEQNHAVRRLRAENAELRRAADFASRMVARYPGARFGGAFLVRLAGAQLELGQPKPALAAARRALSNGIGGEERARALWAEGVAEYRLKDYAAARRSLGLAIAASPHTELERRARELSAVVAEEAGDLAGALEQYLALGYDPDVTYFMDVLMTPDQLSSFVAQHDASPRRDELLYALGLRFMRAGRYPEARATLARVRTSADGYYLSSGAYNYYDPYSENSPDHPKLHFRHDFWEYVNAPGKVFLLSEDAPGGAERDTRVYADWLMRDMQTLSDLERLQGEVDRARGDEEQAEALYQLASYFYEGELLFYNPAGWQGARAMMIDSLGESNYRAPAEAQRVWDYLQEHEGAARALTLYLEVVRLYPRTRAARDSLYTAVLCHQRLSNFNGYWRDMYGRGLHAGARLVTLADLRREYPQYRLPVVGDWKPSTRTVSGEPAWPAPPVRKRLTGVERARTKLKRAELRASQAWELFGEVYDGRVRNWTVTALRWAVVALIALFVLGLFRRTRRARRFLYRQLVRHLRRPPAPRPVYAPTSTYAAHQAHAPFAGLRASVARTAGGLLRLALHERGRAALALNLFTHGLLTMLLWAVLWAARG